MSDDDLFTVDEIVNSYEAIYGLRTIRSVGIIPPFEAANVDTDEYSDLSDDEVVGDVSHLQGRILRATASVVHEESEDETENNEIEGIVGSVTETVPSSSKLSTWDKTKQMNWFFPEYENPYEPSAI
ncbi:hypothetical protein C0J52_25267 [Blattella germanica]|nr:hypothetical protein C0J52_25267 [Blattella germanica]